MGVGGTRGNGRRCRHPCPGRPAPGRAARRRRRSEWVFVRPMGPPTTGTDRVRGRPPGNGRRCRVRCRAGRTAGPQSRGGRRAGGAEARGLRTPGGTAHHPHGPGTSGGRRPPEADDVAESVAEPAGPQKPGRAACGRRRSERVFVRPAGPPTTRTDGHASGRRPPTMGAGGRGPTAPEPGVGALGSHPGTLNAGLARGLLAQQGSCRAYALSPGTETAPGHGAVRSPPRRLARSRCATPPSGPGPPPSPAPPGSSRRPAGRRRTASGACPPGRR
jgi:hypothetical protein